MPPTKFIRQNQQKVDQLITETSNEIYKNWGKAPIFFDLSLFLPETDSNIPICISRKLSKEIRELKLFLIPVIGLHQEVRYQAGIKSLLKQEGNGVCVRIRKNEIVDPELALNLNKFLSGLNVTPGQVDIVIDFGITDNSCPSFAKVRTLLPHLHDWRTFSIISGAFPKDLTEFTPGVRWHPRLEWRTWVSQLTSKPNLPRCPTYGDYTIQHPIFSEPPRNANYSASIRYATDKDWVIMRGEGIRHEGSPGPKQWPANAYLLCKRDEFCGPEFSAGDDYIYGMGHQRKKYGNPESWLRAGINHHLTFVVRQISSLLGT